MSRVKVTKAKAEKPKAVTPEAEKPEVEQTADRTKEHAQLQKALDRVENDATPRLTVKDGRIAVDLPDSLTGELLLMEAVGTGDFDFLYGLLGQLGALTGGPGRPLD